MKKYEAAELHLAIKLLDNITAPNTIIDDFKKTLRTEFKKQNAPKFVKATDAYLLKLKRSDVYIRYLREDDEYYYQGMQGLFERKTGRLLRRHTDTGFLSVPHALPSDI